MKNELLLIERYVLIQKIYCFDLTHKSLDLQSERCRFLLLTTLCPSKKSIATSLNLLHGDWN
jgi:hypothetical protein